jgi:glycosyltransferase involved in cell wall biosynthesis
MKSSVFLFLGHSSQSLFRRLYLEPFGAESFLLWWLKRFRSRHPARKVGIVCTSEAEGNLVLNSGVCPSWVTVCSSSAGNKIKALVEASRQLGCAHLAVCNLEYLFAPPGLLDVMLAYHQECCNSYTLACHLPAAVAPQIFQTELLVRLTELRLPTFPVEPSKALEQLRWLSSQGLDIPLSLRHIPFDARTVYSIQRGDLPDSIKLKTLSDLKTAWTVINEAAATADPLGEMRGWRRAMASRNEEIRNTAATIMSPAIRATSNEPPRILLVSNPSAFSGAEASLCQLATHVDPNQFQMFAAIGAEGVFAERLREAGVHVLCPGYGFGRTCIERALYLAEVISRIRPDIVHLNGVVDAQTWTMLLLRQIPFLTHYRVTDVSVYEDQLRVSTRVITVSEFCKHQVIQVGVDPLRVHVVYDEVDTTEFSPRFRSRASARESLSIPEDAFVVLMIARFAPNKRHFLLLEAVKSVRNKIPRLSIILKGESFGVDSTLRTVEEFIQSHGLANCIRIVPFVDDIRLCHAAADVLVLCSDREALGACPRIQFLRHFGPITY